MNITEKFNGRIPTVREIMQDEELLKTMIENATKVNPITQQIMSQVNCDESGAKTILDNILTNNKTVQTAIKLAIEKEYDLR